MTPEEMKTINEIQDNMQRFRSNLVVPSEEVGCGSVA